MFIHGVFGDLEGTWRNDETGAFWPELLIDDPRLKRFDALLLGFGSPYLARALTLQEVSASLYQRLWDEGIFENYGEVYFVAHSMGGLVTQQILANLNTPGSAAALRKVRGVLLFLGGHPNPATSGHLKTGHHRRAEA